MSHILTYGGGGDVAQMALENFPGTAMHSLSLTCTPIELLSNDGKDSVVTTASGFFWKYRGRSFLVTNWHVITGRDIFTGELKSQFGYVPKRIRFYGSSFVREGAYLTFIRSGMTLELDDETSQKIVCLGMEVFPYDICPIPISEGIVFGADVGREQFKGASSASCYINDHHSDRVITHVGDDCFILGYPLKTCTGLMPPIWKKGSIASEPLVGVNGRPLFLVDAATSSGMSGSPILRRVNAGWSSNDSGDRELSKYSFIGIYGGRVLHASSELHGAGYGWYGSLINKTIEGYYRGLFERD